MVEKVDYEVKTMSMLWNTDMLWMYGKWRHLPEIPGRSTFMEFLTKYKVCIESRIIYLPFIYQPASNYNTIYTVLQYILEDGQRHGHTACIIISDQPLYIKAREMVASSDETSPFSKITVKLGGFQMVMSFFGSIGYIVAGSGLKEVMSTIYAPHSVDKMLSGHAHSRAVGARTLLEVALSQIIFKEIAFGGDDHEFFKLYLENLNEATPTFREIEGLSTVTYLKKKNLLPYFHDAGHYLYRKSARLYIQEMGKFNGKGNFQKVYQQFFTIKWSDKFFCGTSSDMVIEQSLVKSVKIQGRVIHGRSAKESV
ncbi:uncharacterized protein LOC111627117 [Centruroides sculpturatus]|uniref:uncharacterized protein LOC111627117 n=1 Tax=Centruroides sculpturatus TaxID=218467 RepID=UPI000C6CA6B1|nr:uncharacterized protein LOC111627117 [Centruroides sculpturatus]